MNHGFTKGDNIGFGTIARKFKMLPSVIKITHAPGTSSEE